jgi:hypothetical protein
LQVLQEVPSHQGVPRAQQKTQAAAAGDASAAQERIADKNLTFQKDVFDKQQANQQPWLDAGKGALGTLTSGLQPGGQFTKKFTMNDFTADPGYQWRLDQGSKAIERAASANGSAGSGRTLMALNDYAANQATQTYGDAYNRWNNDQSLLYNKYAGMAGVGQSAAGQVNSNASSMAGNANSIYGNLGNQIGSNTIGAGNANAAGQINSSNAWMNTLNNGMNYLAQPNSPGSKTSNGQSIGAGLTDWWKNTTTVRLNEPRRA